MMQTIFLNAAGTVLFVRDDMEQGGWTQEEFSVDATFPFNADKIIREGMRIAFRDPATNNLEMFEIRNVTNQEPEHFQQIIAEHIVVAELSDEHINNAEITGKTATEAITQVLTGTTWSMGNSTVSGTENVDISRGSVWQALNAIAHNFNAYIWPRVTISSAGAVTGKYIDIYPEGGTFRGLLLSVDKNMSDASVVFDDSEVYTALYGYGGNVDKAQTSGDDKTEELTFASVVWTATAEHPAKPDGQTYLEDPAKTALYGRNGRPRFGYYQNGDIDDAELLLEKTWETLKNVSDPKISISGTTSDFYRLGYADQPIRLHDKAIVSERQTGMKFELEIIRNYVDLLDASANRPEIGAYIPNIIYINRETDKKAGGGGGGGRHGQTNAEDDDAKTYAGIEKNSRMIGLVVGTRNGDEYIKAGQIAIAINSSTGQTEAKIDADRIYLNGSTRLSDLMTGTAQVINMTIYDATISALKILSSFKVGNYNAGWKEVTVVTGVGVTLPSISRSTSHYFLYTGAAGRTDPVGTVSGRLVTSYTEGSVSPTTETLYYLGRLSVPSS